jgi:hypothetical protein
MATPASSGATELAMPADLEEALRKPHFFSSLLRFSESEHNAENLLFWQSVGEFEAKAIDLGDPTEGRADLGTVPPPAFVVNAQVALAKDIVSKFVRNGSMYEVNMREVSSRPSGMRCPFTTRWLAQETRTLLNRAVRGNDIYTLRHELASLRTKALQDMFTDIVPRFRKSKLYVSPATPETDGAARSRDDASPFVFGSRRVTISGPRMIVPGGDISSASRSLSARMAALSASPALPSTPAAPSSLIPAKVLDKAVRNLRKRHQVMGVKIRHVLSKNSQHAVTELVSTCKAHVLRTGFLLKRGGSTHSWKRRWFLLTEDVGAAHEDPPPASVPSITSAVAVPSGVAATCVSDGKGVMVPTSSLAVEWLEPGFRSGALMLYFERETDPIPKGIIPMSEVRGLATDLTGYLEGKIFAFGLVTDSRLFAFQAASERTLVRWLDCLRLLFRLSVTADRASSEEPATPKVRRATTIFSGTGRARTTGVSMSWSARDILSVARSPSPALVEEYVTGEPGGRSSVASNASTTWSDSPTPSLRSPSEPARPRGASHLSASPVWDPGRVPGSPDW